MPHLQDESEEDPNWEHCKLYLPKMPETLNSYTRQASKALAAETITSAKNLEEILAGPVR